MRTLHILMPMAGEGSRFLQAGYKTPKPLITVEGIPLFKRAIDGLRSLEVPRKYTFIVRAEHIRNFAIDRRIRAVYPDAGILSVEKTTRGATETCLLAQSRIAEEDAVIVQDCDLEFFSTSFNAGILSDLSGETNVAGRVVSFHAEHPRYSYAETDDSGRVIRTAEKTVISNHALAGAYYFASGKTFLEAAGESVRRYEAAITPSKELYLSLLYNIVIEQGGKILLHELEHYRSFGTPEELAGMEWSAELKD